jgi:hypothetical protein
MIGVGHEVYKGHVRVRQGVPDRAQKPRKSRESGTNGKTAQNSPQGCVKSAQERTA